MSIGCAVDVETTGLDHSSCKVIELALQRFRFDSMGTICEVGTPRTWRDDPREPLASSIQQLTGLTDQDLAGQRIDDDLATALLNSADVIVAHNAGFDRPFVEARLPEVAGRPWACTCRDLDWRSLGFEGSSLSQLLTQCGWFYEPHRAEVDVLALLRLLDHRLPAGEPVLQRLIAAAQEPTFLLEAVGAPFGSKDGLKERGYRWSPQERFWRREVPHAVLEQEKDWLAVHAYGGLGEARVAEVTWRNRYAAPLRTIDRTVQSSRSSEGSPAY
jgi:DNA polymerase-3 subunit epsilon